MVERVINEPTAAAVAYGLDKQDREENIWYLICVEEHLM
jgi:molecular chaperone DnaK (HSP70)